MVEKSLKIALGKIKKRHFEVDNPLMRIVNEEVHSLAYSKNRTQPENNFVSYLIAHYLIELDNKEETELINTTIYPQVQLYKKLVKKTENEQLIEDFNLKIGLYPDLVFHKDQQDNDSKNQKLAIECKIEENLAYDKFSYDMAKLILYISEINFQKAIFLIANSSLETIEKYLKVFKAKYNYPECYNKMEIWVKNFGEELMILPCG